MDICNVANLFRCYNSDRTELKMAIQGTANALNSNTRCLLPPLPSEFVSTDDILYETVESKEVLRNALLTRCGWVGVSGPKSSGKTTKVLGMCHEMMNQCISCNNNNGWDASTSSSSSESESEVNQTLLTQSRDFVWVDLIDVGSEFEVISRVAYQLGLRYVSGV